MINYLGLFLVLSAINTLIVGITLFVDISEFCDIEDLSPLGYILYIVLSEMFILLVISGIYCIQY